MDSPALVAALAAGAGAAAMLLLVTVVLVATRRRRSRADLEAMLAAAQREADDLRHRLDELTGGATRGTPGGPAYLEELFAEPGGATTRADRAAEAAPFVITHVGEDDSEQALDALPVPDRLVLSATLGEPLVKVAAFSHGLRRALSAESRNRIWFEMRREVRASRRRRRQLRKRLEREYRAHLRSAEDLRLDNRPVENRA
jgi:hypothetical protein